MQDKRGREALAQATSLMLMVSTQSTLKFASSICMSSLFLTTYFFSFLECHSGDMAYGSCERPLWVSEKQAEIVQVRKERDLEEERS